MADSSVRRLVGIDFGTSTSLIRVKRYQGSQPIGDNHHTGSVTYGNGAGDSKAVTLVRQNGDRTFTCGRYGEEETPGSTIYREFKMDLESPDPEKQNLAKELTCEYFKYLYSRYEHQQSDLGQSSDQVSTLISYPAKWKPETIAFMEEVAADAGFPNISSMDEPSAALYAVLCRKMEDIAAQGLLTPGQSGYVLLVDMGAGTTDLALCGYTIQSDPGGAVASDRIKTNIVSTWPDDHSLLTFGGREIDRILEDYLIAYLCDCGYSPAMAENVIRGKPNVKAWKEDTVSLLLSQDQEVNTCTLARQYAVIFGQNRPFPAFGRAQFQQMLGSKLEDFRQLILGCLDDAARKAPELSQKGIDLVVLTGGHSSWYFTSELLDGSMPGIDHPFLQKIRQEPSRVLRLSNPQETVALGMVYSQLPFRVEKPEPASAPESADTPTCVPTSVSGSTPEESKPVSVNISGLQDFLSHSNFRPASLVTPDKESILRTNLQVPPQAVTYRAYDSTLFSTAKNGTLFSDLGIHSRSTWGTPAFCSWEDFAEGFLRISSGSIYLHNNRTHTEVLAGSFVSGSDDLMQFYTQLQEAARSTLAPDDPKETSVPSPDELDFSAVKFETLLRKTLYLCNPATLSALTGKSVPSTMRPHFSVPPQETIYFAHDDTWLKLGRNGTIMTDQGVYSRSLGNPVVFTPWPRFAAGTILADGGMLYLQSPGESGKREIGYFGFTPAGAVELYLELQKAFRNAARPAGREAELPAPEPAQQAGPVEKFLSISDWTGLSSAFSPSHIPAVRVDAEPHIGHILLVHRDFDDGDGLRSWFWFAIGEKGIYNHFRQFLSWQEFIDSQIYYDRKATQDTAFPDTCPGFLALGASPCCKIGSFFVPGKGWEMPLRFCLFFRELQKYLRSPNTYAPVQYSWTEERASRLRSFAGESRITGVFMTCSGTPDPQVSAFLTLPASSIPLYQYHSGNLNQLYASACCIDQYGLRSRHYKTMPVQFVPFAKFLSGELWVIGRDGWWYFFAGSHPLFHGQGSGDWMELTYGFLKELQQQLREAT